MNYFYISVQTSLKAVLDQTLSNPIQNGQSQAAMPQKHFAWGSSPHPPAHASISISYYDASLPARESKKRLSH